MPYLSVLSNNKCHFSVLKNLSNLLVKDTGTVGGERGLLRKNATQKVEGNANVPSFKVCEQKMEPILWEYRCFKRAIKPL